MGEFEQSARKGSSIPHDLLPNPSEAVKQAADGAVYRITESGPHQGRRFRLRHPRWVEVVERKKGSKPAAK